MNLISTEQIKEKALKNWDNQRFLQAWLRGESLLPLEIPFRTPGGSELSQQFEAVRRWIQELKKQSKETLGHGYRIVEEEVQNRLLGSQRLPQRVLIETEEDFLRLISKQHAFSRFRRLAEETRRRVPGLETYLQAKPLKLLENAEIWPQVLAVCECFLQRPRPGCYLRQLDIAGVDTKFIEVHKALIAEILEGVLPAEAIDSQVKGLANHGFERRFGLRYEAPSIRFRYLDERLNLSSFSDLTVPLTEFERLAPSVKRVFITENKVNGLCFPEVPEAMVIFGLGYGIQALSSVPWLKELPIHYWGDIDTHGFAILSQLRGYFPQVRSLLMERETLLAYRELWGKEPEDKRCLLELPNLELEEQALFADLKEDRLGDRLRLEQERLPFSWLLSALSVAFPQVGMEIR